MIEKSERHWLETFQNWTGEIYITIIISSPCQCLEDSHLFPLTKEKEVFGRGKAKNLCLLMLGSKTEFQQVSVIGFIHKMRTAHTKIASSHTNVTNVM